MFASRDFILGVIRDKIRKDCPDMPESIVSTIARSGYDKFDVPFSYDMLGQKLSTDQYNINIIDVYFGDEFLYVTQDERNYIWVVFKYEDGNIF